MKQKNRADNRTVLMILYFFPPSNDVGSFRALKFIKHLSEHGWHSIVLTPSNGVYSSYDHGAENGIGDHCTIRRVPLFNPFGFILRLNAPWAKKIHGLLWKTWNRLVVPDAVLLWTLTSFFAARQIIKEHKIPLIFATGNPFSVFILAASVKKFSKNGVRLILDYRDPWTLNPFDKHCFIRRKVEHIMETFVLRHMDAAIFSTDEMRQFQKDGFKNHINPERLYTITNSYEDEETGGNPGAMQNGFSIVHAGNFYGNRNPDSFLQGLALARKRVPQIGNTTHILFYGIYDKKKIMDTVGKLGLEGMVVCKERIPQSELRPILKGSTLLLLVNSYGSGHHIFLPAKLFEYLKAGRPIFCLAKDGALGRVVRETQSGVVVDPEDIEGIAENILDIYNRYYVKNREFSQNAAEVDKFKSAHTTKHLAEVFNKTCMHY